MSQFSLNSWNVSNSRKKNYVSNQRLAFYRKHAPFWPKHIHEIVERSIAMRLVYVCVSLHVCAMCQWRRYCRCHPSYCIHTAMCIDHTFLSHYNRTFKSTLEMITLIMIWDDELAAIDSLNMLNRSIFVCRVMCCCSYCNIVSGCNLVFSF